MFYGKGAGKEATASAVVADIMDCAKHLNSRKYLYWTDDDGSFVERNTNPKVQTFVRLSSDDFEALENQFKSVFGSLRFIKNSFRNEIQFITEPCLKSDLENQLAGFENCKIKTFEILA